MWVCEQDCMCMTFVGTIVYVGVWVCGDVMHDAVMHECTKGTQTNDDTPFPPTPTCTLNDLDLYTIQPDA